MKRFCVIGLCLSIGAVAFAQSTFTIRRPASGSIVREVVKVRIPKGAIPPTGYVGIMVNGKFLEAVTPVGKEDYEGDDFVYKLDTKGRQLPDGNLNIEAVLYADFGDASRALNRSSVRLRLDNRNSLAPPAGGYKLRYKMTPGAQYTYKLEIRQSVSMMSEAQAQLGGRAPDLPQGGFSTRYRYTFDNAYNMGNGKREGLVRMEILPDKGKDYAMLPLQGDPEIKRRPKNQFYPIYMRVTDTGREIFGRSPAYIPMEGSSTANEKQYIFGNFPLPILPTTGVKTGDAWSGAIVQSGMNIETVYSQEKISNPQPARGVLESIEWEGGRPCAKIRTRIATGTKANDGNQAEIEEIYWFSLADGMVTRLERNQVTTQRIRTAGGGGAAQGGGQGGAAGGGARGGRGTDSASGREGDRSMGPEGPGTLNQRSPDGSGERGGGDPRGGRGGNGGGGGVGQGQPGRGGGAGNATRGGVRIIKSRQQFLLTLE